MATKKRMGIPVLDISEIEVTITGTKPLVLLPLGTFKGEKLVDNHDKVAESLKLYRRHDGQLGFPAGAFKEAVITAVANLDKETKAAVATGFHVFGEEETNMVALSGEHHGESFSFDFKKPKRTITLTLPVLNEWSAILHVQFVASVISGKNILKFLDDAGRRVGVGHRRPDKGTFEIK
mgnify:CR=1 FL=1